MHPLLSLTREGREMSLVDSDESLELCIVEKTKNNSHVFLYSPHVYSRSGRVQAERTPRRAVSRCRRATPDEVARTAGRIQRVCYILLTARVPQLSGCMRVSSGASVSTYSVASATRIFEMRPQKIISSHTWIFNRILLQSWFCRNFEIRKNINEERRGWSKNLKFPKNSKRIIIKYVKQHKTFTRIKKMGF